MDCRSSSGGGTTGIMDKIFFLDDTVPGEWVMLIPLAEENIHYLYLQSLGEVISYSLA